jgi:hypothetical protein
VFSRYPFVRTKGSAKTFRANTKGSKNTKVDTKVWAYKWQKRTRCRGAERVKLGEEGGGEIRFRWAGEQRLQHAVDLLCPSTRQ